MALSTKSKQKKVEKRNAKRRAQLHLKNKKTLAAALTQAAHSEEAHCHEPGCTVEHTHAPA